jgi:type II secretory pathway component PulJ
VRINVSGRPLPAFTLIEVVISAAVGAMILAGAYLCLSAGLSSQKMIDPRVDVLQSARVILAMMSADLRSACPLDNNYAFLGMHRTMGEADADNLDFATHNYTPRREREADYCEVSYFVQKDLRSGQLALWRRRNPTLAADPLSGGRREEIAKGLAGVRFEYTDGYDWYDAWGQTNAEKMTGLLAQSAANLTGLPRAVRITLSFAQNPSSAPPTAPAPAPENAERPPESPLVFQTVVGLELAEAGSLPVASGSSSVATNAPSGSGGPPSAPEQPPGGSE